MQKGLLDWISASLNRKFIAGTTAGLAAFSLLFLVLFLGMYRNQLQEERASAAEQVNRLLQTSLEAAMLRRDLDMLRGIIDQFGRQRNITAISIINRSGNIRFSNRPDSIDQPARIDCAGCRFDPAGTTTPFSYFTRNRNGVDVLRTIHPVLNRPPCRECHGDAADHPVNGSLVVDYDASSIQQHARHTTLALMGAGSIIVFVNLLGGWWFIRRYILRPVHLLEQGSQSLSEGDLEARVEIPGGDELARLGHRFNRMADNLQQTLLELRKNQRFLQELVDANPDGIRVIDDDYNVVLANKAYCRQTGLSPEQAVRTSCHQATHQRPEPCAPTLVSCPLARIGNDGRPVKTLHRHTDAEGKQRAMEIYAAPMHLQDPDLEWGGRRFIVESIRDLEQETLISHEQKLSQIGRLAAGVAHEIHNPLASVRLALDSLFRFSDAQGNRLPGEIHAAMELVDREIDRCIEVTERLLKLSMFAGGQPQIVHLNQAISETLSLLQWEAEEDGIRIEQSLATDDPRIVANESDVRIIVLNLVQNAFHAMPDGGLLRVSSRRVGGDVEMCFHDSGRGIPLEDLRSIYDPFFSRRADGKEGTGLGLSITRKLVEGHGGSIRVESSPDEGTCFCIRFPDPDTEEEQAQ